MSAIGNVSQAQSMIKAAVQFGQAQSAHKQQNLRHLEAMHAKQQNVANQVVDQAVDLSSQTAAVKGRIIDAMA